MIARVQHVADVQPVGEKQSIRMPLVIFSGVMAALLMILVMYSKRDNPASPPKPILPPMSTTVVATKHSLPDRELLRFLAHQLVPIGTLQISGTPSLVIGSKRFEVGTRFTVTFQEQDYDLLLVALDRSTFTLRYRNEDYTRPIRSSR